MGCGVDFDTDVGVNHVKVFFTKNGRQVGHSQKMKRPIHGLYPLFGKRDGEKEREKERERDGGGREREALVV